MYRIQIKICEWVNMQRRESFVFMSPKGFPESFESSEEARYIADLYYPNDEAVIHCVH